MGWILRDEDFGAFAHGRERSRFIFPTGEKKPIQRQERARGVLDLTRGQSWPWRIVRWSRPWAYEVSKCAFQEGLRDLDAAFKRFFEGAKSGQRVGDPRFKSKERARPHFRLTGTMNAARNILAAASWPEAQNARGAGVRPDSACTAGQSASKRERRRKVVSHG